MQRQVGCAKVQSIAAESAKFTAPMVLVHGVWCTAAMWRPFMGYLAHRGWSCHALNLRGRAAPSGRETVGHAQFADYLDDVSQVIAACDAPPVVVGHDLGALLALYFGAPAVRAVVGLAPLVPGGLATARQPALSSLGVRLAALRSSPLRAPRGRKGAAWFAQGVPGGTVSDSARVVREVCRRDFRLPADATMPTLVVAGDRDPICPRGDAERLAAHVGAEVRVVDGGGHALPWEQGWERRVSEVHRWLVHKLGEALLVPRDEEDE